MDGVGLVAGLSEIKVKVKSQPAKLSCSWNLSEQSPGIPHVTMWVNTYQSSS